MTNFFGLMLTPMRIHCQYAQGKMQFSNVAMENGSRSKIYLTVNKKNKFILCTLSRKKLQEGLCVKLDEGDYFMLENVGNADVSLVGYQQLPLDPEFGGSPRRERREQDSEPPEDYTHQDDVTRNSYDPLGICRRPVWQ